LDNYFNRLVFFDLSNNKKTNVITFSSDDITREINGFSIIGEDSILLFTYADKMLYSADRQGKIINRIPIKYPTPESDSKLIGFPSPSVENGSPFYIENNEITFVGYLFGEHH